MKSLPKLILAASAFIVSGFMLGIKLLNPTQIQITIEGDETKILPIQEFFTFTDALILVAAAAVLSVTGLYLWHYNYKKNDAALQQIDKERNAIENERQKIELEKQEFRHTLKTLKGDEKIIYETIFAEGGIIFQNELIEKTGFYAAKVTRCLDALENKGLINRKRRGVHNIVSL